MRNSKTLSFLLLGLAFANYAYSSGSMEKSVTVYYTSSLNGNLDGCECKSNPKAGLVKRAAFLRRIDKSRSILLDAGDIFDVDKDPLLSDYILESYRDLGYTAIAVGDQEFSNGTGYLLERIRENNLISNNLKITDEDGSSIPISKDPLFLKKNGLDIVIIAVISPRVFRYYPEYIKDKTDIIPVSDVLKGYLETVKVKNADLRILIFHGPVEEAQNTAEENRSIDVVIAGHDQRLIDTRKTGSTIIVSPGKEGNTTGILEIKKRGNNLSFNNSFVTFDYKTDPDDQPIREMINNYRDKMTTLLQNR